MASAFKCPYCGHNYIGALAGSYGFGICTCERTPNLDEILAEAELQSGLSSLSEPTEGKL